MKFSEYIQIIKKYCGSEMTNANFMRSFFSAILANNIGTNLFLKDDSNVGRIYSGRYEFNSTAKKIRKYVDKDLFVDYMDSMDMTADAVDNFKKDFGADENMGIDEFHEKLFEQFQLFLNLPNKDVENIICTKSENTEGHKDTSEIIYFDFVVDFAVSNINLSVTSETNVVKILGVNGEYTKGVALDFSTTTKNSMLDWANNREKDFTVRITDKRIEKAEQQLLSIKEKMDSGKELTLKENLKYINLNRLIKRFELETELKEKAIEFYLKDDVLQAYCHIFLAGELLDFIKELLNHNYYAMAKCSHNDYKSFDIFTRRHSFIVDLTNKEYNDFVVKDELFKFGGFVVDGGQDFVKIVAIPLYLFLARGVIAGNDVSDYNLNLFEWQYGLH